MQPGVYTFINLKSQTAMDLSAADNRTIIGFPPHGGPNQQWEVASLGGGWSIKSIATRLYLTIDHDPQVRGKYGEIPVIASPYPVSWVITPLDLKAPNYEIFWPHSPLVFDMSNWGDATPGTPVLLATRKEGESCQQWQFSSSTSTLVLRNESDPEVVFDSRMPTRLTRTRTEIAITLISTEVTSEVEEGELDPEMSPTA